MESPNTKSKFKTASTFERLKYYISKGFAPKHILDGGANIGGWSKTLSYIFKDAHYVLVEPNTDLNSALNEKLDDIDLNYTLLNCVLGNSCKEVEFHIFSNDLASSMLAPNANPDHDNLLSTNMLTVDHISKDLDIRFDLIKLDLQGFEYQALLGAKSALKNATMVISEFGTTDGYIGRTKPEELLMFMADQNYRLADIIDLIYTDKGQFLGGDFIFVNNTKW